MKLQKFILIALGCICIGLGAVGTVVPLLPAFPFLLTAAFCFAKSSKRLHSWFIGTKIYKNNLESFMRGRGMTVKTKFRIMAIVSITLMVGFILMSPIPIGRIILAVVWLLHFLYFTFGVRTLAAPVAELIFCKSFKINGMYHRRCARRLESVLNKDGQIYAAVSYEKSMLTVKASKEIQDGPLCEKIHQTGFSALPVKLPSPPLFP